MAELEPRSIDAWLNDLINQLERRCESYGTQSNVGGERHQAALMIGDLVLALSELPQITPSHLQPLKNILMMFNDLENGRSHRWSAPTNYGGSNRHSSATMEVRIWATMAQVVLVRSGVSGRAADKIIQQHLASTKRMYSLAALEKWRREHTAGHDSRLQHVDRLIAEYWSPTRCEHGSDPLKCSSADQRPCPDGKLRALQFAEWAIRTPSFQDRLPSTYRK